MWSVALPFPHGGQSVAEQILAISGWFEAARPTAPHFHLSLLATHNSYRGGGAGMGLLKENLARIDTLGAAAYLESSNPRNSQGGTRAWASSRVPRSRWLRVRS